MPAPIDVTRLTRERDVLRTVTSLVRDTLPAGWSATLDERRRASEDVLSVTGPDGTSADIVIEARLRADPRTAIDITSQLSDKSSFLLAARFLSPRTRQALTDSGVNYADATGNIRLALARPGLHINLDGAERDPLPEARPLRSLKGSAGARVVRALVDAELPVKLGDLARAANVSPAQVGRIVELLTGEAAIERVPRGAVVAVDITKLVERWSEDYSFAGSNPSGIYLESRALDKLLHGLRAADFPYAVTGSLAAQVLAPYAEARLAMIFVDDIDRAASYLELAQIGSRGNVVLAEPFDPVILAGTFERDGVTYAAPAQVAADLLTSPGRGPAEGEELLRSLQRAGR